MNTTIIVSYNLLWVVHEHCTNFVILIRSTEYHSVVLVLLLDPQLVSFVIAYKFPVINGWIIEIQNVPLTFKVGVNLCCLVFGLLQFTHCTVEK